MKLSRYIEIERMTRKPVKDAPINQPRGYGFGAWHSALRDLVAEIDDKKLPEVVAIGRPTVTAGADGVARRMQRQVELTALVDEGGEVGPGHVACELGDDDWRPLIARLFKMVAKPKAETPEIAAAEREVAEKDGELEAGRKRIAELEQENAKLLSNQPSQ